MMAPSPSPISAPSAVPPPPSPPHRSLPPPFSVPPPRSPFSATSPHQLSLAPSSPPPHSPANNPTVNDVSAVVPSDSPSTNSASPSSSPPPAASPPPATSSPPPSTASPPPPSAAPPPPKNNAPPPVTASSPPPPLPDPPKSSPPPPITPISSPPPPSQDPPAITPTTPTPTPSPSPPPQSSNPPSTSPPQRSDPPQISPPPTDGPSQSSPPPSSQPPQTPNSPPLKDSSPSPASPPSTNSTTPPSTFNPPPPLSPVSQPSTNSSTTPLIPVPPPPSSSGLSRPSPTQLQMPPPGFQTHDSNPPSRNGNVRTEVAVSIGIVLGFLLLGAVGIAAWCMSKRSKRVAGTPTSLTSSPHTDSSLLKRSPTDSRSPSEYLYSPSEAGGMGNSRPWFTFEALGDATNGFSEENLLGEGGFGRVYKGHLPDGQEVAVKQLKIGGGQGEREFKAEVDIISRIHHRHLVSLAGYCISDSRRLLVYEYVCNNTLHYHLHGPDRPVMTWQTRVKIAVGAARGIAYLHEDCTPRIIHRDIKSANILLDKNFEARVSDFGLAKLAEDANSHVTTRVMGTFGYMAPEYASSGKLTEKSDVFSFGVVLLELITGRKPVDTSQPLGEESLVEWARPKLSHALATEEFEDLVDLRLEKNYPDNEMLRAIEAAAACVRHSVTKRPTMGQVVRAFESMVSADLTNGMRVGESAIYNNSAELSAEVRLFRRMAFGSQDNTMDTFSQGSWHS